MTQPPSSRTAAVTPSGGTATPTASPDAATPSPSPAITPALEVIATTVEDAHAAARGGADRLEVVSAMEADGLLPDVDLVRRLRDAVSVPLRAMLRSEPGYGAGALDGLCRAAEQLRAAGIDEFVFGFMTAGGQLDRPAILALHAAAAPRAWTLHRAFDYTAGAARAFAQCADLPGLDLILSAGSRDGLDAGLATLCRRATWQSARPRWLAGGGLRPEHIPPLRAAGITQFHSGRAVRRGHRWDAPVDESLVRHLKDVVLGAPLPTPRMPPPTSRDPHPAEPG